MRQRERGWGRRDGPERELGRRELGCGERKREEEKRLGLAKRRKNKREKERGLGWTKRKKRERLLK